MRNVQGGQCASVRAGTRIPRTAPQGLGVIRSVTGRGGQPGHPETVSIVPCDGTPPRGQQGGRRDREGFVQLAQRAHAVNAAPRLRSPAVARPLRGGSEKAAQRALSRAVQAGVTGGGWVKILRCMTRSRWMCGRGGVRNAVTPRLGDCGLCHSSTGHPAGRMWSRVRHVRSSSGTGPSGWPWGWLRIWSQRAPCCVRWSWLSRGLSGGIAHLWRGDRVGIASRTRRMTEQRNRRGCAVRLDPLGAK